MKKLIIAIIALAATISIILISATGYLYSQSVSYGQKIEAKLAEIEETDAAAGSLGGALSREQAFNSTLDFGNTKEVANYLADLSETLSSPVSSFTEYIDEATTQTVELQQILDEYPEYNFFLQQKYPKQQLQETLDEYVILVQKVDSFLDVFKKLDVIVNKYVAILRNANIQLDEDDFNSYGNNATKLKNLANKLDKQLSLMQAIETEVDAEKLLKRMYVISFGMINDSYEFLGQTGDIINRILAGDYSAQSDFDTYQEAFTTSSSNKSKELQKKILEFTEEIQDYFEI